MSIPKQLMTALIGTILLLGFSGCESSSKVTYAPPAIYFSDASGAPLGSASAVEGTLPANTYNAYITVAGPYHEDIFITLEVGAAGTATQGVDYGAIATNLVRDASPTANRLTVPLTIIDDTDTEESESFSITITAVSAGELFLPVTFTFTIGDNDGTT